MAQKKHPEPTRQIALAEHPAQIAAAEAEGSITAVWRPIYCGGFEEIVKGKLKDGTPLIKREYHHFTKKDCNCKPGPQWLALQIEVGELALGGGRGSAKSEVGFAWLIQGDSASNGAMYIENRHYTALILRRNAKDLENWFKRAKEIFEPLGAVAVESPSMRFRWPSGAEFILDHFQDESAYMKYQGQEFQRILIEEAPQIPKLEWYKNLRKSNRSTKPGLKASILLTANPGGPGMRWFKDRFYKLRRPDGSIVPFGEIWTDPNSGETRSFIHSTVYDNPYFLIGNADYRRQLEGEEDENERRRWLLGDFDALVGQFFTTFRDTPLAGEPENAQHVIPYSSFKPEPWWPRIAAMDIGFKHHAAVLKGALAPNGRIYIYGELVEAGVEPEEWGFRIAKWLWQELRGLPNHSMPLFLSHEAFGDRAEGRSLAQQVEEGLQKVLGRNATFLMPSQESEDPEDRDFFRRLDFQTQQARVIIRKPFSKQRVPGWNYMRGLMRWRGHEIRNRSEFDPEYAQMLLETESASRMMEYLREFDARPQEVLPKLQITDNCKLLRQAIISVAYDDGPSAKNHEDIKKTETVDDDVADCARYLCTGYRRISQRAMPQGQYLEQRMADMIRSGIPIFGMEGIEEDILNDQAGVFSLGVGSSRNSGVQVM